MKVISQKKKKNCCEGTKQGCKVLCKGVHGLGWVGLRGFFDPTHCGGSKKIQPNPTHMGRVEPMGLTNFYYYCRAREFVIPAHFPLGSKAHAKERCCRGHATKVQMA